MLTALTTLRSRLRWHRRAVAALAAALCLFAVLMVLRPAPPPSQRVVVVTAPVTAGTPISSAQVSLVARPVSALPEGALADVSAVIGAIPVADLTRGSVITATLLFDSRRTRGDGQVLVPLRLSDPAITALVQVGDVVSVVSTDVSGTPVVLASRVRVAALARAGGGSGPLDTTQGSDGLVFVVSDAQTGARLAAATAHGPVGLLLG